MIYRVIRLYYGTDRLGDLRLTLRGSGRGKEKRKKGGLGSSWRDGRFKLGMLVNQGE